MVSVVADHCSVNLLALLLEPVATVQVAFAVDSDYEYADKKLVILQNESSNLPFGCRNANDALSGHLIVSINP